MSIKRRDFLLASIAAAACGQEPTEMPLIIPSKFIPKDLPKPRLSGQSPASPVHLSSSAVLRAGATVSVPLAALRNPMGQDMEILEIKFELSGSGTSTSFTFGGSICCELSMGSIKLTNGSIPVWNFGRAENLEGELQTDSTDALGFASYSWRLPRPFFVPAGAVLVPKFVHTAFVSSTINVRIGYSARTIFVKPKKFYVPWVAKYASKAFNPISAADVDVSSESDLVNTNPEVLHIQRFVGRTQILRVAGTSSENLPQSFGSQYLLMRMTDSYGRPIVRNYTPFRSVFSPLTRSWEMSNGAELDPDSFYRVFLRKDLTSLAGGGDTGAVGQAFISVVGWRELENM